MYFSRFREYPSVLDLMTTASFWGIYVGYFGPIRCVREQSYVCANGHVGMLRIYKIRSLCAIIYLKSNSPSLKNKIKPNSLNCSCPKRTLNLNNFITSKYHNSLMKITKVEYSNDHS